MIRLTPRIKIAGCALTGGLVVLLVLASCGALPLNDQSSQTTRDPASLTPNIQNTTVTNASSTSASPPSIAIEPLKTPDQSGEINNAPFQVPAAPDYPLIYYAQSGDTLDVVASHFNISATEITSPNPIPAQGWIPYEQPLYLPARLAILVKPDFILPDSEVVFGPSAVDFNIAAYLRKSRGDLATYREYLASTGWTSAADIVKRIALENSINPRLLLALLEYHCHGVLGKFSTEVTKDALLGNGDFRRSGLYRQLSWASSQLSVGYYGWRSGKLHEFSLADGSVIHPAPNLNAGTVALQYYLAFENNQQTWAKATDPQTGFAALYTSMFGDPWERAASVEPLLPAGMTQTPMQLPFEAERGWAYTSGPHPAWENEGALAALDFAPATYNSGCQPTDAWVAAVADGRVVRSAFNAVMQDVTDPATGVGDGLEQTGWAVLYMHIAEKGMVPANVYLKAGQRIGQPSCEGGRATGTHVHIARKYNGEWMLGDGAMPFNLSGWISHAGENPYEGTLTKDGQTVIAHWFGSFETRIALPTPTPSNP